MTGEKMKVNRRAFIAGVAALLAVPSLVFETAASAPLPQVARFRLNKHYRPKEDQYLYRLEWREPVKSGGLMNYGIDFMSDDDWEDSRFAERHLRPAAANLQRYIEEKGWEFPEGHVIERSDA